MENMENKAARRAGGGFLGPRVDYIKKHFAAEDQLLTSIREAMHADNLGHMSLSPYEGHILKFLTTMVGAKKVVELGSLYAYSSVWIARGMAQASASGASDERPVLYSVDHNPEHIAKARSLLKDTPEAEVIEFLCSEALQALGSLDGSFDMVFIDAQKSEYPRYLDWAAKHLRKGGLVVGDNCFLFGHMFQNSSTWDSASNIAQENMEAFNAALAESGKFTSACFATHEGLVVGQLK